MIYRIRRTWLRRALVLLLAPVAVTLVALSAIEAGLIELYRAARDDGYEWGFTLAGCWRRR